MRPFSRRTLLLFSPSYSSSPFSSLLSVKVSHFSASPIKLHDEQSKNVSVSVWWDFENCGVPVGANVFKLAHNISTAVRYNGIKGSIQITAYGDMLQLSRANQEALSATGINLTHIPQGGKNTADRSLLVDLMYWVSQNPPPAHLFLISADGDFANILHRLRMHNYNILLASKKALPPVLCSAATIVWQWEDLVRGQDLLGKHFNRPPDGPYGSWYGNYKAPIEDPFSLAGQPMCSPKVESVDSGSDSRIPKKVLERISMILESYPDGISIGDFRLELVKARVSLGRDFYGYKKFSSFLLSMPHILNLENLGKGRFMIRGVTGTIDNGDCDVIASSPFDSDIFVSQLFDQNVETGEVSVVDEVKPEKTSPDEQVKVVEIVDDPGSPQIPKEVLEKISMILESYPDGIHIVQFREELENAHISLGKNFFGYKKFSSFLLSMPHILNLEKQGKGYFMVRGVTGSRDNGDCYVTALSPGEELSLEEVQEPSQPAEKVVGIVDELVIDNVSDPSLEVGIFEKSDEECSSGDTFEKEEAEGLCGESRNLDTVKDHPAPSSSTDNVPDTSLVPCNDESNVKPGFFERVVKWCRIWRSDNESEILSEQACSVENELFAKDSFWSDMEAFLDTPRGYIIVYQSMTREELAQSLRKEGPADLSSVTEQDLLRLVDLLITEKNWVQESSSQNPPFKLLRTLENTTSANPHNGKYNELSKKPVSPAVSGKQQPTGTFESKILSDCEMLVNSILKSHPEGYYIGSFRKAFYNRYNYSFDLKQLGYDKLASLLESFPGVKVESSYIFPLSSDWEDRPSKREDVSGLSQWDDELGPISSSSESKKSGRKTNRRKFEYELPVSDDDDSDSENIGSPRNVTKLKSRKPGRTYSFVADSGGTKTKDHLIDDILTNLKKSGEPKMSS